jgi:hypothetical protein
MKHQPESQVFPEVFKQGIQQLDQVGMGPDVQVTFDAHHVPRRDETRQSVKMVAMKMRNKDVPDAFETELHLPESDLCPFTAVN